MKTPLVLSTQLPLLRVLQVVKTVTETGIEVGYSTAVGPATLAVGYGTYSVAADDGVSMYRTGYTTAPSNDYSKGGSMQDIEVKLSYSF